MCSINYNKRYTLKEYIKKRVSKTIIPYLAWSILGLIIKVFYLKSVLPETVTPEYVISGILQGNIIGIYWFFIPLFCVYLSIPLFSAVSDEKKKDIFTYVCVVCFIINALVPFVLKVVPFDVGFSAVIRIGSGYLLFVLIGYLITKYDIPLAIRIVFYVLAIFGFILQVIGTYFFSMKAGEIVSIFKGYENVPSILQSVGVFVFFKYIGSRIMKIGWINILINFFSKYTFPLYLLHWYILEMVLKEFSVEKTSMFFRLATPFIALGITVGITFLIRKVPVLRRILP